MHLQIGGGRCSKGRHGRLLDAAAFIINDGGGAVGDDDNGSGGRRTAARAGGANKYGRGRLWVRQCYPPLRMVAMEGGRQYRPGGGNFPSYVGKAREIGKSS
jgi:hypothetical protein